MSKLIAVASASGSPIRLTSLSKGKRAKKHSTPRSAFFSLLMTGLAGDTGNEIAKAMTDKDMDKFKSLMSEVIDQIAETAESQKYDF